MRVVDLSHQISTGMPVFPGDPAVRIREAASIEAHGFRVCELHLGSHSGTHLDAPSHTVPAGPTLDQLTLGQLIGEARVVRVPDASALSVISLDTVRDQLDGVGPNTMVLFDTGWSQYFGEDEYYRHPSLDVGIAHFLIEHGVTVLGVDTLNPDHTPAADEEFVGLPVHDAFLGAGNVIIENLTNLAAIDWPRPTVIALPLSLGAVDGSPVRVVAVQGLSSHTSASQ
ncbi:cyclase family protein [Lysinibacter cavernae]|uniref:Kynurenine formamidase n=1 Tax=Lysinibacter cavernae TaxID=1640652 RepID=A0A7X5R3E4_9MICO|nr:cyclase family protein [Lysinibacter cavernae]NIH54048.1 kynurenine formamidase [Lysinibacter cavernae]NIH54945.1 kynurenine formamidase [Lysinibacter cavernae]